MPILDQNDVGVIRAAGGLLWRRSSSGYEVATVRRTRYGDWTLPKGKLEAGESWKEAALREVREETGFQGSPCGFAGAIAYKTDKGLKLVCFWHMILPDGETVGSLDTETAEVIWVSIQAARGCLDYPLERALLEVWDSPTRESEGTPGD